MYHLQVVYYLIKLSTFVMISVFNRRIIWLLYHLFWFAIVARKYFKQNWKIIFLHYQYYTKYAFKKYLNCMNFNCSSNNNNYSLLLYKIIIILIDSYCIFMPEISSNILSIIFTFLDIETNRTFCTCNYASLKVEWIVFIVFGSTLSYLLEFFWAFDNFF